MIPGILILTLRETNKYIHTGIKVYMEHLKRADIFVLLWTENETRCHLFHRFLDKSPASEPSSLHPLSVRRFLASLSTGQHPRPGHSTCERYRFHPRLSTEKRFKKMCGWHILLWNIVHPVECDTDCLAFLGTHLTAGLVA